MKRSEMIKIIEIAADGDIFYSNTSEDILKAMEEAGMLPPYAEISTLEYELDEHGLLGDLIKWVNTAHEWESEDEN